MPKKLINKGKRMKNLVRFTDSYDVKEKIILRDHLALQRTKLANERTLLTYLRSAIYLIIAGFAFLGIEDFKGMPYLGELCFVFSAILLVVGLIRFYQLRKQLDDIYKDPELINDED